MANEFQTFVDKWTKVAGQLQPYNIPMSSAAPIVQQDQQALLRGTRPLTEENAFLSVLQTAGLKPNQQLFAERPAPTGWNPMHLLGNAGKDLSQIAQGLNPVHLVPGLIHEAENAPQIPGDVSKALGEHSAGAALRDLAQTPMLRMIPGVQTAAELTSGKGREQIVQHPLMTFLDILPYADMTAEALVGKSVWEVSGSKVPESIRQKWNDIWDNLQLGKHPKDTSQHSNIVNRATEKDITEWRKQAEATLLRDLPPDRKASFAAMLHRGDPTELASLTPEEAAVMRSAYALSAYARDIAVAKGEQVLIENPFDPTGKAEAYDARGSGPQNQVVRAQQAMLRQQEVIVRLQEARETAPTEDMRQVAQAKLDEVHRKLQEVTGAFHAKMRGTAPERWVPLIQQNVVKDFVTAAGGDITPEARAQALEAIDKGDISGGMSAAGLDPTTFHDMMAEAAAKWTELAKEGLNPIATRRLSMDNLHAMMSPSVALDHIPSLQLAKEKALDLTNHVSDLELELGAPVAERIMQQQSAAFIEWAKQQPYVRTREQIITELDKSGLKAAKDPRISSEAYQMDLLRKQGWVAWDPNSARPYAKITNLEPDPTKYFIPRWMKTTMDQLQGSLAPKGLRALSGKALRVFRTSVLIFSPSWYVHTALGSTVMMLGETGPGAFSFLGDALKMVKDGTMPDTIARYGGGGVLDKTDFIFHHMAGRQLGGLWADALKQRLGVEGRPLATIEEASMHFHNFVADMHRAMTYLYTESKNPGDLEKAAEVANRVIVNMDRMTPMERNIIRQVVPFYGWMSHVMRYVLTYPVDHPIRASIVSKFATMEQTDWRSGISPYLQQLFFLGSPDKKGNVSSINLRSLNPFRDVSNWVTLSGFVSSLNPAFGSVLESLGIQLPSGSPDLYPQLGVDPVTGQLVAKHQNIMPLILSNFIPETNVIEGMLGWSSSLRDLRQSNPQAYSQQLWSSLGVPWVPRQYSVPQVEASEMRARETAAQSDVSHALKTGDWSSAIRWGVVPYQGKLVDPRQLEALVKQLQAGFRHSLGAGATPPGDVLLNSLPRGLVPSLLASGVSTQDLSP